MGDSGDSPAHEHSKMRRKWLGPIACVCLAAFFVANSHASTAIAVYLNGRLAPVQRHGSDLHHEDADPGHDDSNCCQDESCPCHDEPADSPCPCCPKGPSDQSCPCPGGCVFCSVAKVPCVDVPVISRPEALCLGEKILESLSLYLSPVYGALIRPPRS